MSQKNSAGLVPAIAGGVIGAALTAVGLFLAGPSMLGERMVRETLVSNPEIIIDAGQALKDKQYAETLQPIRALLALLKTSDPLVRAVSERWMLYETREPEQRAALLRIIFDRLKDAGRFDPLSQLQSSWDSLEMEAHARFVGGM